MDEIQQARDCGEERWAQGRVEGRAEGMAQAILMMLDARGIPVNEETRARIAECKDDATLGRWIASAASASTADELFAPA